MNGVTPCHIKVNIVDVVVVRGVDRGEFRKERSWIFCEGMEV